MKLYKIMAWVVLLISIITVIPMLVLLVEAAITEHFDDSMLGAIIHGIKY